MVQKKSEKVRYRVNKEVSKPEEEHIVVHNTHEPIIDPYTWEKTQRKLRCDTRNFKLKSYIIFILKRIQNKVYLYDNTIGKER